MSSTILEISRKIAEIKEHYKTTTNKISKSMEHSVNSEQIDNLLNDIKNETTNLENNVNHIKELVNKSKQNGLRSVLEERDLDRLYSYIKGESPDQTLLDKQNKKSSVLLSLIQQLTFLIEKDPEITLNWIQSALLELNIHDHLSANFFGPISDTLITRLENVNLKGAQHVKHILNSFRIDLNKYSQDQSLNH